MKLLPLSIFVASAAALAEAEAQYAEPNCYPGTLCENSNMCALVTGSCDINGTTCLDSDGEPTECIEPYNECYGNYCSETYFCGGALTKDCVEDTCENRQKEQCPQTLSGDSDTIWECEETAPGEVDYDCIPPVTGTTSSALFGTLARSAQYVSIVAGSLVFLSAFYF